MNFPELKIVEFKFCNNYRDGQVTELRLMGHIPGDARRALDQACCEGKTLTFRLVDVSGPFPQPIPGANFDFRPLTRDVKIEQVRVIDRRDSQDAEFTFVVRVKADKASAEALLDAYANRSDFAFDLTASWKPEQCDTTALYDRSDPKDIMNWKSIGRTLVFR